MMYLMGFAPTTSWIRTERAPKRASHINPKVRPKNSENKNKQPKISRTVSIFVIYEVFNSKILRLKMLSYGQILEWLRNSSRGHCVTPLCNKHTLQKFYEGL